MFQINIQFYHCTLKAIFLLTVVFFLDNNIQTGCDPLKTESCNLTLTRLKLGVESNSNLDIDTARLYVNLIKYRDTSLG